MSSAVLDIHFDVPVYETKRALTVQPLLYLEQFLVDVMVLYES